ncbi:MBL fold metallo-hydrolase [Corynebacterium sp. 319]|uniref:MBL fold metallo-hydrolase n=1 Tax=unclassified Corynebacterium TaxID=2624378 RepID=UPI00125CCEF2|nr:MULTISPECIES: MBL fold metallo-hydrolase [unclassified Corynebacterium]KAB1551824.1 MBL fold metallo-hydrolase [Corynebacterium sp. 319]KAB3538819.1 MBL fold metallo-hydrolase [Corynebacterium sp. 366]
MARDFPPVTSPVVEQFVTSGTFRLDGGEWEVDNNVYLVADEASNSVIVIDPAHEPDTITAKVGDRSVRAIVLTHAHNDHCDLAPELAKRWGVDVYLHPDDDVLWKESNGEAPYVPIDVEDPLWAQWSLMLHHTPGHTPGCVVIEVLDADNADGEATNVLLSGDTLFNGGPGATGRKYSSFETIIESLKNVVFELPHSMMVLPGHGDATTIGAEAARIDEYIERGY